MSAKFKVGQTVVVNGTYRGKVSAKVSAERSADGQERIIVRNGPFVYRARPQDVEKVK
jgi:hypothetical protein